MKLKFTPKIPERAGKSLAVLLFLGVVDSGFISGAELNVGPGQAFQKIEEALVNAAPGDTILVHPQPQDQPYEKVALLIRKSSLTIRAVNETSSRRVCLSGAGFDYSGEGAVPRAIVQFDPAAHGCILDGFELSGARNQSFNGAGVRINQANDILVTHCEIHNNDMGIMSNGSALASPPTGGNQRIEHCLIHHNGAMGAPGYNHNLYLGGASVTLLDCEVHSSTTGHNIKSRAHFIRIVDCYIHDAAAREVDLVDEAGSTDRAGSDALLLGNVIVKSRDNKGNHTVILFGQDTKHERNGTLYLVHNTIVTPFISPVIDLSAQSVRVRLSNNLIWDGGSGQPGQVLVESPTGSQSDLVAGQDNFFCGGFGPQGDLGVSVPGTEPPPFVAPDQGDYHLAKSDARLCGVARPLQAAPIPSELLSGLGDLPDNSDIGAFAFKP